MPLPHVGMIDFWPVAQIGESGPCLRGGVHDRELIAVDGTSAGSNPARLGCYRNRRQ
jgi:hypothetical protein